MSKIIAALTSKNMQIRIIIFWSLVASALWITFFAMGLLINSKPYRDCVADEAELFSLLMCILVYTPTNIAILCLTASYLGGCASSLVIHNVIEHETSDSQPKTKSRIYMSERPMSAMVRGILVYFAYIAGVCIADAGLFNEPTLPAYIKSAGIISLLAFLVGYDPTIFHAFIGMAENATIKK